MNGPPVPFQRPGRDAKLRVLRYRLAPDGLVLVVQMTRTNLERHASPGAPYLISPGAMPGLLPGIEPILYEEGWSVEDRHEARLLGRRAR